MAVKIDGVETGSAAERLGILPGDFIVTADGFPVNDLLDYGFRTAAVDFDIEVRRGNGEIRTLRVHKGEYEDVGLQFNDFLMDGQHSCRNRCIFCFIDQLPPGMRGTLYFKDDDERLSYLFGNYITLTNLSDAEVGRIIEMRITPINISVHTMNEELRCRMMGNRFAGECLSYLRRLAKAKIKLNCQIVLCRGINDGAELEYTLRELSALYPSVQSVAVVPVGLTGHREGLARLDAYDAESAGKVLDMLEQWNRRIRERHGTGLIYPADEWYFLAGRPFPPLCFYDDLSQLENGVGMAALFSDEFLKALTERSAGGSARASDVVTGEASAPLIRRLLKEAEKVFPGAAAVHCVKNEFFGGAITVAGLVTGGDIKNQLPPESLVGERILIPRSMLRSEGDLFLDGVSLAELKDHYQREIIPISDGFVLLKTLLG